MSKSRTPLYLGAAAVGGIGYYLYSSGGDSKTAQKKFESDLHSASAKVKGEIPGRGKELEKDAEKYGAQAGAKFDKAVSTANSELHKARNDAESYAQDARSSALKKIDEADRKIEEGAAKAKGSVSGWFGGSK